MAGPIQAILSGATPQEAVKGATNQAQTPQRSFENVLRAGQNQPQDSQRSASGAEIERLRVELMEKTSQFNSQINTLNNLMPDLTKGANRRGLLQEAMQGINRSSLGGDNVKGILATLETNWLNVERIMTSDKGLSTGELLGLQARLYQVSQHVEVVSKVVDQVTGGIKTILNTNI
jgi:hypothetical protein